MDPDTVTWIGTAASILGGGIAIWQAVQAKGAARAAKKARDDIFGRHEHGELGVLDGVLGTACKAMEKYGPGSRVASVRGSSPDGDAFAVRAFTAALDRHKELVTRAFGRPCDDVRDRINGLLDDFGGAANVDERFPVGKSIYIEISNFSGNLKAALDDKTFGAHGGQPTIRTI